MAQTTKPPPLGKGDGHGNVSSSAADTFPVNRNRPVTQINSRAAREARHRLRRQRLVEHLHRLGPSPLGHFIREVEDAARVDVTPRLERYAEINPEFVRALGGDKFPPRFLHALDEGSEP